MFQQSSCNLLVKSENKPVLLIFAGDQASLFTGVLYGGYGPPGGFCFQCGDPPIMVNCMKKLYFYPKWKFYASFIYKLKTKHAALNN